MKKLIAVSLLAFFGVVGSLAWFTYLETHDIDISSGRRRVSRSVLFFTIDTQIRETAVSELLAGEVGEADWHRENSFVAGSRVSPHHIFHGASSQLRWLEQMWDMFQMNDAERRASASHLLSIWRLTESGFGGSEYISSLGDFFDGATWEERLRFRELVMPAEKDENGVYSRTVFFADGMPLASYEGFIDPSTGRFVKDGVWRWWNSNGALETYGHSLRGLGNGRRFEWNRDGILSSISAFDHGHLVEFENENLSEHPEYEIARQIAESNRRRRQSGSVGPN